ncbi:hypothetical protein [Mucisphaera calidilacus]|nr:hypothetical protein [Mucisphaera calidilacus]
MVSFAQDDDYSRYAPTIEVGHDDLSYLWTGGYLHTTDITVCPATLNQVTVQRDDYEELQRASRHAYDEEGGHSYETFHHVSPGEFPGGLVINQHRQLSLKDPMRPADTFIVLDSDNDPDAGGMNDGLFGYNNLPDAATNNHGERGLNVAFLDGRIRFVTASQWVEVMLRSAHLNADSIDLVRARALYEPRIQWGLRQDGNDGLRYWLE